eukprot:CAMPEP_0202752944 /NCGR_PEP_ID=MMETSP1388-20130828/13229_1 /ASSEMBLY_ACC=CAM_ASM_000864 /TAXON_ID=37098 /ORGANISM="Isochrysis sp, Strain CCMP1244" /LENGTH=171 /DNA_ID=CAMNT_0049420675 /DNA_START=52 /DNA_END=564 /DNA_ORIENTATION=-
MAHVHVAPADAPLRFGGVSAASHASRRPRPRVRPRKGPRGEVEETLLHASQPPVKQGRRHLRLGEVRQQLLRRCPDLPREPLLRRRAERDKAAQQRAVDDLRELALGRGAGALRAEAARVEAGGVLHRRNHLCGQKVEPSEGRLLHLREAADGAVQRRVEQRVPPPAAGGG